MLKKIKTIILIALIVVVFYGCSKSSEDIDLAGIHIFNKKENLKLDYIPEEDILLSKVIDQKVDYALIVTDNGQEVRVDEDIMLKKDKRGIHGESKGLLTKIIVGIYIGNEIPGISKLYFDIKTSLDRDEKVLAVFLDGLSYEQYLIAKEDKRIDFLEENFTTPARSVYTPVTNAGFASMITGTLPPENGVYDRSYRDLEVESIFAYALEKDKKQLLIEGNIKILNTEIEPLLNVDANKNGDTDDEAYFALLEAMEEDYDFLFVHFHGIDDRGHTYGPYGRETMDYIEKIDGYLAEINNLWDGRILITADHGMHKTKEGGDHGQCRNEDMIVPYFIRESLYE